MKELSGIKLIHCEKEKLNRGAILRIKGEYPYEDVVDFMLFENFELDRGLALIVTTGRKAGLISDYFPLESCPERNRSYILTQWLIDNWHTYGLECSIDDVYVIPGYEKPPYPPE